MFIEVILLVLIFYLIFITKPKNPFDSLEITKIYAFATFYYNLIKIFIFNDNEVYQIYEDLTRKLPSPSTLNVFIVPHTFVDKPEDIQTVLYSSMGRPLCYSFSHNETGLITAQEPIWKVHRKLLNSSFNIKVLQSFFPIFNCNNDILLSKLSENQDTFDIGPYFTRFTMDTICGTSFGWNSQMQQGKHHAFFDAVNKLPDIFFKRASNILLHPDFIYKRTKLYKDEIIHYNNFYKMTSTVVAGKRQDYNKELIETKIDETIKNDDDDNIVYNKPQIFINKLFNLFDKGQIPEKSIFEHSDTILGAGTETSASVLADAILLLAMHPDIQERVYQELRNTFPEQESYVSHDDISKLTYLDMVVKETMRLFQIVPIFARKATSDFRLSNGLFVKKGDTVHVLITNLHENPISFPNPKQFNPDHFLPEKIAARHPYSFIPFGGGPRICIGHRYSMFLMKTTLAKVLRKYKFTTVEKMENIRTQHAVTTKLLTKHYVKLHKRDYVFSVEKI